MSKYPEPFETVDALVDKYGPPDTVYVGTEQLAAMVREMFPNATVEINPALGRLGWWALSDKWETWTKGGSW